MTNKHQLMKTKAERKDFCENTCVEPVDIDQIVAQDIKHEMLSYPNISDYVNFLIKAIEEERDVPSTNILCKNLNNINTSEHDHLGEAPSLLNSMDLALVEDSPDSFDPYLPEFHPIEWDHTKMTEKEWLMHDYGHAENGFTHIKSTSKFDFGGDEVLKRRPSGVATPQLPYERYYRDLFDDHHDFLESIGE